MLARSFVTALVVFTLVVLFAAGSTTQGKFNPDKGVSTLVAK